MQRSTPPESRHHPRRPQEVVEVGAADADDAGADLDGAELAFGDELADESFRDGELVGGFSHCEHYAPRVRGRTGLGHQVLLRGGLRCYLPSAGPSCEGPTGTDRLRALRVRR